MNTGKGVVKEVTVKWTQCFKVGFNFSFNPAKKNKKKTKTRMWFYD